MLKTEGTRCCHVYMVVITMMIMVAVLKTEGKVWSHMCVVMLTMILVQQCSTRKENCIPHVCDNNGKDQGGTAIKTESKSGSTVHYIIYYGNGVMAVLKTDGKRYALSPLMHYSMVMMALVMALRR